MTVGVTVGGLTVEYQRTPMPLAAKHPRFAWQMTAPGRRGVRQRAFELAVGTGPAPQEPGAALWRTGPVSGASSVGVAYDGPALAPRTRYFWAVRAWTHDGAPTPWSDVAWWETGLDLGDWQAEWVEPVQRPTREDPPRSVEERMGLAPAAIHHELLQPAQYVRRSFDVRPGLARARVYATAHGVYTAEINGRRLGSQELAPEPTAYQDLLMYQAYDATDLVQEGPNAIGFIVADGWWAGRLGLAGRAANYGTRLALLAQVELHYDDDTIEVIGSDASFRASTGAIEYADLLIGERFDARRHPDGWSSPGYDDGAWEAVTVTPTPLDNLVAHLGEPVRVIDELPATSAHTTADGGLVLDFAQVVCGRVRLELTDLEAGTEIAIRHVQALDGDGDWFDSIAGANNENLDVYVARGGGPELFEPRHTFHGFRYAKITGLRAPSHLERATAVALSSDVSQDLSLAASDPRIERLQRNVGWVLRDNLVSIPMDNPDRERAGWTGDFAVIAATAMANLGLSAFTRRYLANVVVEQFEDGTVPMVVPLTTGYREMLHDVLGAWSSPAWGDVATIAPWAAYRAYGDERLLEDSYATMRRFMSQTTAEAARSVTSADLADPDLAAIRRPAGYMFGDWMTPSVVTITPAGSYDGLHGLRTADLIPTLYYLRSADILAEVSRVLGRAEQETEYRELAARLRRAFRKAFLRDDGRLSQDTQGNYVLALAFRVAPELDGLLALRLAELITGNGGRLDTGFQSTEFLLPVLSEHGFNDLAYAVLLADGVPGWMHMLDRGATAMWEMWEAVDADGTTHRVSHAQPGLASIGRWLVEYLVGIRAAAPGFERILLHPVPGPGLDWAGGRYRSVRGPIATRWERRGDAMRIDVEIPANTTATVVLEGARLPEVTLDGAPAAGHPDVASAGQDGDRVAIGVGSGDYRFEFPYRPPVPVERRPTPARATTGHPGRHDLRIDTYEAVMADPDVRAAVERIAPELPRQPLIAVAGQALPFEFALRLAIPALGAERVDVLRREVEALT